jgi:hypothetical protein
LSSALPPQTQSPGWPAGWWAPLDQHAAGFESELRREVSPGHILSELPVRALGKRERDDNVAFAIDGDERVAVVHLTWSGRPEPPPWPTTTVHESLSAFRAATPDDEP